MSTLALAHGGQGFGGVLPGEPLICLGAYGPLWRLKGGNWGKEAKAPAGFRKTQDVKFKL